MAKDNRKLVSLQCEKCKNINYHTEKRVKGENVPKRLEMKKYCKHCDEKTPHKETK